MTVEAVKLITSLMCEGSWTCPLRITYRSVLGPSYSTLEYSIDGSMQDVYLAKAVETWDLETEDDKCFQLSPELAN